MTHRKLELNFYSLTPQKVKLRPREMKCLLTVTQQMHGRARTQGYRMLYMVYNPATGYFKGNEG